MLISETGINKIVDKALREDLASIVTMARPVLEGFEEILRPELLPMRLRAYLSPRAAQSEQPSFLLRLEVAKRFDVTKLGPPRERPVAVPGSEDAYTVPDNGTQLRWDPTTSEEHLLWLGVGYDIIKKLPTWWHKLSKPRLRRSARTIFKTARQCPVYTLIHFGNLARVTPQLQGLQGLLGPDGMYLACYLHLDQGRLALTAHSGLRPGSGLIGSLLPKDVGNAMPLSSAMTAADAEIYADLGSSAARSFEGLLRMASTALSKQAAQLATGRLGNEVLASWNGKLSAAVSMDHGAVDLRLGLQTGAEEGILQRILAAQGKDAPKGDHFILVKNQLEARIQSIPTTIRRDQQVLRILRGTHRPPAKNKKSTGHRLLRQYRAPVKLWIHPHSVAQYVNRRTTVPRDADPEPFMLGSDAVKILFQRRAKTGILVLGDWNKGGTRMTYILAEE